ncbi:MAG: thrombospondin type 3 repeat-containing protein, partial [Patescibacteria group bacterium]
TGSRFYLPPNADSYSILTKLAVSITNTDLNKIPIALVSYKGTDSDSDGLSDELEIALGTNSNNVDSDNDGFNDNVEISNGYNPNGSGALPIDFTFTNEQKGKIFIQVESGSQIWYVSVIDGKRYFIPTGDEAGLILETFSKCISDNDAHKIPVGLVVKGEGLNSVSSCYPPPPSVLGEVDELPRTGFPLDLLGSLPLLAILAIGIGRISKEWITSNEV